MIFKALQVFRGGTTVFQTERLGSRPRQSTKHSGCTSAWPDYFPWKEEDVGSNPTALTNIALWRAWWREVIVDHLQAGSIPV